MRIMILNMVGTAASGRKKPLCLVSMNFPSGVPPPEMHTWRWGWKFSFCPQICITLTIMGFSPTNLRSAQNVMGVSLTQTDAATSEQEIQGLVEWAQAFRADSWEKVHGLGNPGIKEAVKTMELIMSNPTERDLIRARIDAEIDHRALMLEAEARGEARGEEKGEARGRAIGKADAHKQDALRMKELGMSSDLISSITGLSPKDISEL